LTQLVDPPDKSNRLVPTREKAAQHFVLSVNNDDFDDLDEARKLYQVPPTVKLRGMANIPVVDETGEGLRVSFRVVRARQLAWGCYEMPEELNRASANTRPSR
jgi:hypothetical protein